MRLPFLLLFLASLPAFAADAPAPLTPPASAESFEYLRKLGSDALEAGDFEVARIHLQKALKLKPKDRLARVLHAEARRAKRRKDEDQLAESLPRRLGLRLEAGMINGGLDGAQAALGWMQPDPERLAVGLRLGGMASHLGEYDWNDYDFSGASPVKKSRTRRWGNDFGGDLQLEWRPWHGRGLRNRFFMLNSLGWGFHQAYRNEVKTDYQTSPETIRADSYTVYESGPVVSMGGGFSSRWGLESEASATLLFLGGSFPFSRPLQLKLSLAYLF